MCNGINSYSLIRSYIRIHGLTLVSLEQCGICFAHRMSWITTFLFVKARILYMRCHTQLRALIASAMCLDKSIEFSEVNGNRWFHVYSTCQPCRDMSQHLRLRNLTDMRSTNCRWKVASIVHPLQVDCSRDNSNLMTEANRPEMCRNI